ncbi:MAG: hypothetical protein AcusKO_13790 [Acuticoccus sp.]
MISNEHPDMLARMAPDPALKEAVRAAARRAREAKTMTVISEAGSDPQCRHGRRADRGRLGVDGPAGHAGTLAGRHRGVVSPRAGTVAGRLVLSPGDMNLTYKRYVEAPVALTLEDDRIVAIEGEGVDARLMRDTLAAWG